MSAIPDPFAGVPDREAGIRAKPRPLSTKDRATAAALAASARLVNRVAGDASLAAVLETKGYNAAELQAGVTLQTAAEEVFDSCQQALGELDRAQAAFDFAWESAREEYLEFRWIARREYPNTYTQQMLQVVGVLSDDLHEFIAQAAISYRAAQLLKPAQPLIRYGFGPDRINAALSELRRLAQLKLALQARRAGADRHCEERDMAVAMLNLWMREFERVARVALRSGARPPAAGSRPMERDSGGSRPARSGRRPHSLRFGNRVRGSRL